ncbi:MAG TPA: thioredoxin domain-containing protein, partial [Candidatus Methylomirabilis sp.]
MTQEATPRHTNRLARETSPYLLQHAHNPVDWYPWGEEVLRLARETERPILLSIGYSACHWCHVMEHESFEDEAIAKLMNDHFVCVKVDREERPDLDEIYMAATLALNHGQGGWPMTVFLTPEQRPFFAGTYFPPADMYGRPGFATLLTRIADLWRNHRDDLRQQAAQLTRHLTEAAGAPAAMPVGEAELAAAAAQLAEEFDAVNGGFGPAPKFPPAAGLSLLLRHHRRTADEHALHMVEKTLRAMAEGGICDQVGGGFHRYSTDERWLVPHFEKMLYDNALLAKAYLEAFQVTGDGFYRRVAAQVLDYVLREMTSPEGGFSSATDADSEGEEGKFFVWTPGEIQAILGEEEARRFCAYYDITEKGNWEGVSIPNVRRPLDQVAKSLGIAPEALAASLEASRGKVYEARKRRVPPGLDDKILTAWNGLMIGAMAEGSRVLGDRRYLEAAARAADFLLAALARPDGGLLRTWRAGRAHLNAYLEDYACLCEALVDLYEAGGTARYLREAERLADRLVRDFGDGAGGAFYSTARDHEALIMRRREGTDGATPSPNAVAAHALARLSFHLDREDLREAATGAIRAYGKAIARYPRAFAKTLAAVDLLLEGPLELALVGAPGEAGFEALRREVGRRYVPNRIVAMANPAGGDGGAAGLPLLAGKTLVHGKAALYLCRHFACQAPITDPAEVCAALASGAGAAPGGRRNVIGRPLPAGATPEGSAARAARLAPSLNGRAFALLGSTGLTASRV